MLAIGQVEFAVYEVLDFCDHRLILVPSLAIFLLRIPLPQEATGAPCRTWCRGGVCSPPFADQASMRVAALIRLIGSIPCS